MKITAIFVVAILEKVMIHLSAYLKKQKAIVNREYPFC